MIRKATLKDLDELSKDESQFSALLEYLVELKKNCPEICAPVRALSGKIYEKLEFEDRILAVTKFEKAKGGLTALMVIEIDENVDDRVLEQISFIPHITKVSKINN